MARWAPADSPSSARRSGSMPSSPACARTQRSPWRTSSSGAGKRWAGARRYESEMVAMPRRAKCSALPAAWLGSPCIQAPPWTKIPEALGAIAALILPGGGDVDPAHYGGARHEANYGISPERDGFELALARAALALQDLPILCICRGMQLVNVALGGDLLSHIPDHFGDKVRHRHPELRPVEHPVSIEPASRLASILGATELTVHSVHHQAVGRLGQGLRAGAWSPGGLIEAVESERHPFLIGVQWHPELGALGDEP